MIAVSVARTWPTAETPAEQLAAVQGDWRISGGTLNRHVGEVLLGIAKGNQVVAVRRITGWRAVNDGRVRLETEESTDPSFVPGDSAPAWAEWRKGQANPVRIGPIVGGGDGPSVQAPVEVGPGTVAWLDGAVVVRVPAGVRVVVDTTG